MRFSEVQSPVPNSRMWVSKTGDYSFVIMREMDPRAEEWVGYTATWKDRTKDMRPFGVVGYPRGTQPINRIGGVWGTFAEAESACELVLRALRMRH